jgi:hypothetical protein
VEHSELLAQCPRSQLGGRLAGWQDFGMAELCYFTGPMDWGKWTLDTVPVPDAGLGDAGQEVTYEVLCRRHHRRRVSRPVARASLSEPIPLSDEGTADEL